MPKQAILNQNEVEPNLPGGNIPPAQFM